uniref:Thioredoxin domain-containing protein n=1 Tax=Leptobrachium leishanense TaxID=445787 RepID=A0A8C5PKZ2_9ANUR
MSCTLCTSLAVALLWLHPPVTLVTVPADRVPLLDGSTFQAQLCSQEMLAVMFIIPRCGECMRLTPEYEEAAIRLQGAGGLAKVDCSVTPQVCGQYSVARYPTLMTFRNGEQAGTYEGSYSAASIVRYIRKESNPNSHEIRSLEQLETFTKDADAGIVGFFEDRRNPNLPRFLRAERSLEIYRFAFTCVPDILDMFNIDKAGIVLFRPAHLQSKFENSTLRFSGSISVTQIKKFIQRNIFGLCPIMSLENRRTLRQKDLMTAFYNVDFKNNPRMTSYWRNRILMVVKKFHDAGEKLNCAIADRREFSFELSEYGIETMSGEAPAIVIRTTKGHKYVMREAFTRDGQALERFLSQYFSGKLRRYFRSQPIPPKNNSAVQLVHDPHLVIAKMDATSNDVPAPYEITGFPTIYFVPMESKHAPTLYKGDWHAKDILGFLQDESSHRLIIGSSGKQREKTEL